MKPVTLLSTAAAVASSVFAHPDCPFAADWQKPKANETRGVCPMLNTLSNYGLLPRDGRNITEENTIFALGEALNIDAEFASFLYNGAMLSVEDPEATTYNLDSLDRHNVIEHDGSLSRQDAHFGSHHHFNATVFETTKAFWPGDTLTVQIVANARAMRHMVSALTNPEYSLNPLGSDFSFGENAALLSILGDKKANEVPKDQIVYFFEEEKLPCSLGWVKPTEYTTLDDLDATFDQIRNHTAYPPEPTEPEEEGEETAAKKRRNIHVRRR